jgi:alkanesulfonate monooxygenase SsuD/methylene tetrahydromethanopterin reductase-like flavin-dependent oxidoreductase (luciferase family)
VLQVVPRLLRGETVTFQGSYCHVENATLPHLPVQQPYIPLLVAGGGRRTLRLVAEYADASNLTGEAWGGGAASDADVRHKYEVLQEHCAALGRPYASVVRTYNFLPALLADTLEALEAKRAQIPPRLLAFGGAAALIGTPEDAVQRILPLVAAGCQYVNFGVQDPGTLHLLAERVIPAVRAGAP